MGSSELPKDWVANTLGDLFDFKGGGTPDKKNPAYWGGDIPWASVKDIKTQYLTKTVDHITEKGLKESASNLANPGELILLTRIEPGKVAIVKTPVAVNQDCKIAKPKKNVDLSWAYYLFLAIEKEFIKRSSGTTVLGIRLNDLNKIPVLLPPINEQKRIVKKIEELFSELDNGVSSLKTAREQLKVYRQSLLKHAFEGKLTEKWREENKHKLETPEQLLARIQRERDARYQHQLVDWKKAIKKWEVTAEKEKKPSKPKKPESYESICSSEELSTLPDEWTWVHLGELVSGIDQGWSPKCENTPASIGEWGVIKTTSVQYGFFIEEENKELPMQLAPREQHELKFGDILITRAGPRNRVGVCCLVRKVRSKLMNCDKVYRIRSVETICLPEYVEAVLNSPSILDVLEKIKSGINDSGVNLNQGAFLNMAVPYCSLHEQAEILSVIEESLSSLKKQEELISAALMQSELLRQSILKKAFSGKLISQEDVSELSNQIKSQKVPDNVIPFPAAIQNIAATDLHAGIIAMAYRLHEQTPDKLNHFGHVKAEKISHLVESHLGLSLGRQPVKDAAGPNDYPHLKKVEHRASKANWFDVKQQTNGQYIFIPKKGFDRLLEKTHQVLDSRLSDVENLLQLMLPMTMRQAEILATVYAAWNNLLILGKTPSDEEIVTEARENWHQSKLNIERDKFFTALGWMRKKNIVPSGRGHLVKEKNGQKA